MPHPFSILLIAGVLITCLTYCYVNQYAIVQTPPPTMTRTSQELERHNRLKGIDQYVTIDNEEKLQLHCDECAVVSNSGRLLNTGAGATIDNTECVIRMNTAPTTGFERDVGARTTIRVVGHANMKKLQSMPAMMKEFFRDPIRRTQYLLVPWLYMARVNKTTNQYYKITRALSKEYSNITFYVSTVESMQTAEDVFRQETGISRKNARTWFTTGWLTMLLAIAICNNIAVYGMLEHHHCQNHEDDPTLYHYYNPKDGKECRYYKRSEESLAWGHLFITEKAIFEHWAHQAPITFHYPFWNISGTSSNFLDTPFITKYRYRYQHHHQFSKWSRIQRLGLRSSDSNQYKPNSFPIKLILLTFFIPFLLLICCICCL